jgi:hypothetical protein
MIKITYELTGLMDEVILEGVIAKATDAIKAKLTEEEQSQIRITVKGASLDDLSLNISGPDIVLAKLK